MEKIIELFLIDLIIYLLSKSWLEIYFNSLILVMKYNICYMSLIKAKT